MSDLLEELRAALYSVWQRRWLALAVAWGVCLLGWLVIALIPNAYEAKASIYVDVDDVLSEQMGIANDGQEEIQRVRQTLVSAINLRKVISSTELGKEITSDKEMQAAIEELRPDVEVRSEQDSLFSIVATIGESNLSDAENAVVARNVVQKLLDIFREEHIVGNRAGISQGVAELNEQLEERKVELEAAEERRLAFEAQYPELIGGSVTLSTKVQQARSDLREIEADLAAAQSALGAITGQINSTPRTIVDGPNATGPQAALSQAQTQLATLRARGLKDSHPDVAAAQNQIRILQDQVAATDGDAGGTTNPAYSSLLAIRADRQAAVESAQAQRAAIQSQIASLLASQASEPAVAAEANRISRDYEVLRKNYEDLLQDREDLRTRGDVEDQTSQFRFTVTDPPVVPQKPIAPNRPLLLLGILFVGAGAGAGVAWAMGQLRSGFATPQKLERALDIPVIGSISLNRSNVDRSLERLRLKQFAGACAGLVAVFVVLLVIEMIAVASVA